MSDKLPSNEKSDLNRTFTGEEIENFVKELSIFCSQTPGVGSFTKLRNSTQPLKNRDRCKPEEAFSRKIIGESHL